MEFDTNPAREPDSVRIVTLIPTLLFLAFILTANLRLVYWTCFGPMCRREWTKNRETVILLDSPLLLAYYYYYLQGEPLDVSRP